MELKKLADKYGYHVGEMSWDPLVRKFTAYLFPVCPTPRYGIRRFFGPTKLLVRKEMHRFLNGLHKGPIIGVSGIELTARIQRRFNKQESLKTSRRTKRCKNT